MPNIKVKPVDLTVTKWKTNLPASVDFIKYGVEATTKEWEERALAASKTYKEAVTATDIEQRYIGGIKRTGHEGWKKAMLDIGVDRIRDGVDKSVDKYQKGVAPYLDAIAKIDKPPRKPRGHPDNLKIVGIIASTLHELRKKQKGAV